MPTDDVIGIILAGGRSQRMGGADKAFLALHGKSLIARCVERAKPQVGRMLIGANGDPKRFDGLGCEVVADAMPDFAGPLAGILSGLEWAQKNRPGTQWLASFACDTPFFPTDMVESLMRAAASENAPIAVAASAGRRHPVFALWNTEITGLARQAIAGGLHKVDALMSRRFTTTQVEFAVETGDPFFNINAPADLERAAEFMRNSG